AKEIQGGGGGQPFFATAGGKDIKGLEAALSIGRQYMKDQLQ
ncbi:MAG: alanyl-tRNA synthetase, partial [Cyclobacteriaceae bacterium]